MKKALKITGAVLAATITTSPIFNLAQADISSAADDVAPVAGQEAPALKLMEQIKVSDVARSAVTGIHFAKQALTSGDADAAKEILDEVTGLFSDKDAALVVKTDTGYVLPLDRGFGLTEDFTPTEEHAPIFAEVDLLMQSGDINGVVIILNDAGIDLVAQVAVIPYSATIEGIKQVVADIDSGQLEKAGTDLDAMLSSIKVESYTRDALPTQGYAPEAIAQS